MALLERISTPADLRRLLPEELASLCGECRQRIFEAVSKNGGHLSSNLGVVELTLALHYVYDFGPYPQGPDWLLWDVGHQCYVHKLLTGRAGQFERLRKQGSISGFPLPLESAYDLFAVGHAGTAISTAVGMARADALLKRDSHVVAVVGDASIVNGMAFEGLNAAGTLKRQMLVVLNDNGMGISQPQGALAQYLERVRISSTYNEAKSLAQKMVHSLPASVGDRLGAMLHHVKEGVKSSIWPGQIFEALGIKYMGPFDGHDLPGLINLLAELKDVQTPVLLHVKTVKGHGYEMTCEEPTKFHSPPAFKMHGRQVELHQSSGKSWTSAFADALIDRAKQDSRVVALTAAMPDGTGLSKVEKELPGRCIDAGICESHLVGMAAGMCKSGLRPVVAVYSTFTQRCFDQIWQEVILNGLPVVFCLDRAGFVGDDGAVHHGFMDLAFLRPMPGMVLMAPSDEADLQRALKLALSLDVACAIRYPRDSVPAVNFEELIDDALRPAARSDWQVGKSRLLRSGADATILVYGALADSALAVAEGLAEEEELSVGVIDARFCKPLDGEAIARILKSGQALLTVEDHALQNGFGTAVLEYAAAHGLPTERIVRLGMPDRLIAHATRSQQLAEAGLDEAGLARAVRAAIRADKRTPAAFATPRT